MARALCKRKYACLIALAAALALLAGSGVFALLPAQNAAGGLWLRAAAECTSSASPQNGAGARAEIVGAAELGLDSVNPAGAALFLGHLDPLPAPENRTGVAPLDFENYR